MFISSSAVKAAFHDPNGWKQTGPRGERLHKNKHMLRNNHVNAKYLMLIFTETFSCRPIGKCKNLH